MKDSLGDRMKRYEDTFRNYLNRRMYTIIRVDGKAFHTYTRQFDKPFDDILMQTMDETALYLARMVQGCKLAYIQSDEISLIVTDFDELETNMWFDGNIQKIVSVSSSFATAMFNSEIKMRWSSFFKRFQGLSFAHFDARVFQVATLTEAENYLLWRQRDATRNSIQMVANSLYSHKELHKKNTDMLQEMIFQKGTNWNDFSARYKRGRIIYKDSDGWMIDNNIPIFNVPDSYLQKIIPNNA